MYGIYANIWGILMGSMLPYIAYMDPMGYGELIILLENNYIWRVILTKTHFMNPILSTRLGELEIQPPTVGPYNAGPQLCLFRTLINTIVRSIINRSYWSYDPPTWLSYISHKFHQFPFVSWFNQHFPMVSWREFLLGGTEQVRHFIHLRPWQALMWYKAAPAKLASLVWSPPLRGEPGELTGTLDERNAGSDDLDALYTLYIYTYTYNYIYIYICVCVYIYDIPSCGLWKRKWVHWIRSVKIHLKTLALWRSRQDWYNI